MASNIRVTLELDNKKYIADLKAADTTTQQFAAKTDANVTQVSKSLGRLNQSTDLMVKKFGGLRTALAGLGFAALGRSALLAADELQDLSNSSGIAVARLLELKDALITSGGAADQLPTAINQFARSIDEAAQGSLKAQNSFAELKVSLGDLRTLSEQDLFIKTLEGIVAVEDKSRQATLMMDKFGKSFKTVDPQELLNKLKATRGEGDAYAASIARAAQLNDQFAAAQSKLKIAFLEAFSPAIKLLTELNTSMEGSNSKMLMLVDTIKLVGIALATAFAISAGAGFVAILGQVGRALTSIIGLLGGAKAASSGLAGVFAGGSKLMVGIRGVVVAIAGIGTALVSANLLFEDFSDKAVNALARIVEAIGAIAPAIAGGAIGAAFGSAFGPIGTIIGGIVGGFTGDKIAEKVGLPELIAKARKSREELEKTAAYAKKIGGGRGSAEGMPQARPEDGVAVITSAGLQGTMTKEVKPVREVTDALAQRRREIEQSIKSFQDYNNNVIRTIAFENTLIGKTEDEITVERARQAVYDRAREQIDELTKAKAALSKDERALAKVYDDQIAKIEEQQDAYANAAASATQSNLSLQQVERARKQDLENIVKAIEQQIAANEALGDSLRQVNDQARDLKFERSLIGLSEYEKQLKRIQEEGRKTTQQLQQAFASQAEFNIEDPMGMTPATFQRFNAGLDEISKRQQRNTKDALDNVAASRTWAAGWDEAFANYRDNALNAADQAQTYFTTFTRGVEDAIVRFVQTGKLSFKDLANSIIGEFARIAAKNLILSIFGDSKGSSGLFGQLVSTLFGGFRASGGPVSAGKAYVVGEQGPELFMPKNAGSIIPNGVQIGTSQPSVTNVNYNIQAVDASSFRSLVARDPEFLFAVTEQGRRSLPIRNRR